MLNETEKANEKELEILLNGKSNSVVKKSTTNDKSSKFHSVQNKTMEIVIERNPAKTLDNSYYVIPVISTKYKISIYKPLVPLRIALFLWYGAGKIPVAYLNVFMKLKGFSLEEHSAIFPLASLFQFLFAFASGVIADRFGNAKPVLLTHVIVTILCVLSLPFIPNINLDNVMLEEDSKIFPEESLKDFEKCEEFFKRSSQNQSTIPPHNKFSKVKDYSEKYLRQLIEICTQLNASGSDSIPVSKSADFNEIYKELKNDSSEKISELSNRNIFSLVYIVLIIIFFSSWSTVYHFLDVTIMSFPKKFKVNFGYEHFFSMCGYTFITFVTSVLLNHFALPDKHDNCQSLYVLSACLMFLSLVSMCFVQSQVKTQSREMLKEGQRFLKNRDVWVFIIVVFLFGTSFGVIDSSSLWFLEHLNAPKLVFALQQTLTGLYGLPFLFTSLYWFRKFGPMLLLVMAFCGYTIFGIGYALLFNPWLSLLLEASCIVTRHLLWFTVIIHTCNIAPGGLSSTIIAVFGALHYGIGRIVGGSSFGLVADSIGPRIAFGVFSGVNLLYAICYSLIMYTKKTKVVRECN